MITTRVLIYHSSTKQRRPVLAAQYMDISNIFSLKAQVIQAVVLVV